jgi:glutamate-1-semialdehyde 2,1-aminomutase
MWTWFFTEQRVVDFATAATSDTARFGAFHRAMLDAGVWLPPSQFEAIFLGTAHTSEIIEATIHAARQAVASLQEAQPAR